MQTALSVVAIVLSALSLGWQAATYVLTGGRVHVELRVGAVDPSGTGMVHGPVSSATPDWAEHQARQGYTRPVVGVLVRNRGRLPVTVTEWTLVGSHELNFRPIGLSIGPELPYRLDLGASELWVTDLGSVLGLGSFRGRVSLGDGRTYTTRELARL